MIHYIPEESHLAECEAQPDDKDCICLKLTLEREDDEANRRVDEELGK
jgi:hypothetical protein